MATAFYRGQQLGKDDIYIFVENESGVPTNPAEIYYALYDFTTGQEVLLGAPQRTPANASVGHYYASIIVPLDANLGVYRVRWTLRRTFGGPVHQVAQEFSVIDTVTTPTFSSAETDMVRRLRTLLRDNDPDRNYKFRPPARETTVGQFNRVFGYIWTDDEMKEFLERGLDDIIAAPPRTPFQNIEQMIQCYPEWKTLLLNAAMTHALFAVMTNWISEDFTYSIGGVSLDMEKASKYESAYQAMKETWEAKLERAKETVKYIRGLQQPRYGMGIRSSFGPAVGRGKLTPSKYLGF